MDDDLPDDVPGAGFERGKRLVGVFLGPAVAASLYLAADGGPAPALAALMGLTVTWWLTEALPPAAVALFTAALAVMTGLAPAKVAFGAFGSPLLFMFVGSFFIAEAMKVHGFGERVARATANLAHNPATLLCALSATTFGLSAFMSNAAATAIILPIALAAAQPAAPRYQAAMVLAIAWGASMGGLVTPVGTPPNLIGLRELTARGAPVDFATWAAIGLPIGLAMLGVMWVVLFAMFGRGDRLTVNRTPARPWSRGEISIIVALGLAILGWLTPSVIHLLADDTAADRWARAHLGEEVVAIVAGGLLFVLPGGARRRPRPALTWSEATRIDWGVILLFGGGILLGDLARETGLTATWGRSLAELTGAHSSWAVVALVTGVAIVLSEATSNTATATLMVPLAAGMVPAGESVVPAVLGATLGSSFGFMMPISTAPNAMAYGTGKVSMMQMMRAGIVFDVVGFVVVVAGLRLLCPLFGLD